MAGVIFYSTGEIFWVSDPPSNGREHIGVHTVWPAVPSDEFFSYAKAAMRADAQKTTHPVVQEV